MNFKKIAGFMIICSQFPIIFVNVVEFSNRNHPGVKKKVNSKVNSKEENHEKRVPPPPKKRTKLGIIYV